MSYRIACRGGGVSDPRYSYSVNPVPSPLPSLASHNMRQASVRRHHGSARRSGIMPSIKLSVPKKTKCTIGSIVDFTFSLTNDDFHLASVLVIHTNRSPRFCFSFQWLFSGRCEHIGQILCRSSFVRLRVPETR